MAATDEGLGSGRPTVTLRMFAAAREAAGVSTAQVEGSTVGEVVAEADRRYGADFAAVRAVSRVWVNGEAAGDGTGLCAGDEVAILPPVSGGWW